MNSIKIPNKINNEVVESLLYQINKSSDDCNLEVPLELIYRGFGLMPSLLLVTFSWMRKSKGKLIIPIDIEDAQNLKKFSNDYFGYVIVSTVWKSNEIINSDGIPLKEIFRKQTHRMHLKIDFLEQLPNEAVLIPCFDHYSNEKGLSHWFYINDFKFADSPSKLENTVFRIFEYLGKIYKSRINSNVAKSLDNLQTIIWELLKNTDEHTKKDYLNQIDLSPSTRGLFLKLHRSSKKNLIENSNKHIGLENYYNAALKENDNFILEISVFDSGPGMAKRFLGANWKESVTATEEVDIIKKCLIKGVSSVSGFQGEHKGLGLDNVLHTLNSRKGFLKIRSGHVSIYRDLIESPYSETTDIDKVILKDWDKNNASNFTRMDLTQGTLITMAYPINELQ